MEIEGRELTASVDPPIRPMDGTRVSFDFDETARYPFDARSGDALETETDAVDLAVVGTAKH